jgi:hypothetical protein
MWEIKRFLVVSGSVLSTVICVPFVCTTKLSPAIVSVLFALDGIGPSSVSNLAYHWVREAFVIELVGTCMGAINLFWWASGPIGQLVCGWNTSRKDTKSGIHNP